jgi:hypothetical protein
MASSSSMKMIAGDFFYLTNDHQTAAPEVVFLANDRCNQENLIDQLKHGVGAMRMPVDTLLSNWAYMVMTTLAWTLKAWFALRWPHLRPIGRIPTSAETPHFCPRDPPCWARISRTSSAVHSRTGGVPMALNQCSRDDDGV